MIFLTWSEARRDRYTNCLKRSERLRIRDSFTNCLVNKLSHFYFRSRRLADQSLFLSRLTSLFFLASRFARGNLWTKPLLFRLRFKRTFSSPYKNRNRSFKPQKISLNQNTDFPLPWQPSIARFLPHSCCEIHTPAALVFMGNVVWKSIISGCFHAFSQL